MLLGTGAFLLYMYTSTADASICSKYVYQSLIRWLRFCACECVCVLYACQHFASGADLCYATLSKVLSFIFVLTWFLLLLLQYRRRRRCGCRHHIHLRMLLYIRSVLLRLTPHHHILWTIFFLPDNCSLPTTLRYIALWLSPSDLNSIKYFLIVIFSYKVDIFPSMSWS